MPSVTSISSITLENVGPLTATFTAPHTCATPGEVYLGLRQLGVHGGAYWASTCDTITTFTRPDCYPAGSAMNRIYRSDGDHGIYHSPGLACPESWTTAGVAVKDKKGDISSSGVFDPPFSTIFGGETGGVHPRVDPYPNIFMNAMDAGETAAICCPSGYTALWQGACFSSMPIASYSASVGCERFIIPDQNSGLTVVTETYDYYGKTVTGYEEVFPTDADSISTETTTFDASGLSSYFAVASEPIVLLVHKEADMSLLVTKTDGAAAPTETSNDSDTSETPDAAVPGRMTTGSSAGILMTVSGVAAIVGALMIVL